MFNDWWISMRMPFHWIIFQMERVGTRPEKVPLRIFQREQGHFHSFWAYLLATSHDRKSYNVDILWNRQRKKEHTLPWLKTILIYRFFFPSQELSIQHIRDVSLNCPPDSLAYRVVVVFQDKLSWSSCRVTSQGALWKACPCYCTISSCLGFCKKRGAFIWGSQKNEAPYRRKDFIIFQGPCLCFSECS